MFNYKEIATPGSIKSYIRKFWVLDHLNSPLFSDSKYALPNGCFTLAFISGKGIIIESANKATTIKSGIYLIGQVTKRLKITVNPYSKAILAQLNPWTPSLITRHSLSELIDQFAELDLVNKQLNKAFSAINISDENSLIPKIYNEMEDAFYETNDSYFIKHVVGIFTANLTDAPLKIADIALHTGYSKRYLEKKFSQNAGLSPKEMYSILRLRSVVNSLQHQAEKLSLTHLALEFGYFDQSHFIKTYAGIMHSQPGKFKASDYILPLGN
jgi:AraC-like DNA-binding protein